MKHTGIRLAVALAALVVFAAACGDDSGDPFSSTTDAESSTTNGGVGKYPALATASRRVISFSSLS